MPVVKESERVRRACRLTEQTEPIGKKTVKVGSGAIEKHVAAHERRIEKFYNRKTGLSCRIRTAFVF